jgi:hypothetical protein
MLGVLGLTSPLRTNYPDSHSLLHDLHLRVGRFRARVVITTGRDCHTLPSLAAGPVEATQPHWCTTMSCQNRLSQT